MEKDELGLGGLDAAMLHGVLKIVILVHLRKSGMHPYALLKHFRRSRHAAFTDLKKSDVYNAIKSLEDGGYIKYNPVKKGSQIQKRYELTAKGKRVAGKSKAIISKAFAGMKSLIKSEFNEE